MAKSCKITVEAGPRSRRYCPVSVLIPLDYGDVGGVALKDAKTKKEIPCQIARTESGVLATWLVDSLQANGKQTLIAQTSRKSAPDRVMLTDREVDQCVDIAILGKPFTTYHYGLAWVRPFLYPVLGPDGARMTRGYPVDKGIKGEKQDHPHHKSIWVAYGECDRVDNWSEDTGHGWQRHRKFVRKASGPVFGHIVAKNDWCANDERKQFEETRDMRFYALPGGVRLFDVSVTFHMTERAVTFRDTKEGGLISVRVASSMDVPVSGRIENGYGGINEAETWGKSAPWCDYSGKADGVHAGIALMDHEFNPRYPTGWHVRNYGLMTANCFAWSHYRPETKVRGDMTFAKNSKTTWRYRVYIHRGDAKKGNVGERFHDFINPPNVTVE